MDPYPKIETVWKRNPETDYSTLIEGAWTRPEFKMLKELNWDWEEKIDGTNIRIQWDGSNRYILGKKDKSEIPDFLLDRLKELVTQEQFARLYPDTAMCLYGEGFGHKIQKRGDKYDPQYQHFIVFDIRIRGLWLKRKDVADIAKNVGLPTPHIVGKGSLEAAIDTARKGFHSYLGNTQAEGLVLRPPRILFDRRGRRIITKIKCSDFRRC